MRIAVSNLAWDITDDEAVAALLNKHGIDAIDIVPAKYFAVPQLTSAAEVIRVRDWWHQQGIAVTGMQALLFGTTGLNLFGSNETQNAMLNHLDAVCRIGSWLGATKLVFGSPRNRDRSLLTDTSARNLAITFFRRLGDIAGRHGVWVCLEPNPTCYGSNFMINSDETASIVTAISHPAIRMQLDTGALTINGEDARLVIRKYAPLIGHVHASEPHLVTQVNSMTDHAVVADSLRTYSPEQVVTIEMLPAKSGSSLDAIERALLAAVLHYGTRVVRQGDAS